MGSGGAHVLELSGISKTYGVTRALTDVSIAIPPGEIVGLIGHNGAGKSTLMRIIVGLTRPDSGSVNVGGAPAGDGYSLQESRARGVRIAYQELSLAPELKVFENVLVASPALARLAVAPPQPEAPAGDLGRGFPRAPHPGPAAGPPALSCAAADAGDRAGRARGDGLLLAAHPG